MFDIQSHFIFPRHAVGSPGKLPDSAEALTIKTADGETLHGVHIPSKVRKRERTLLIGFAGNAWNSQDAAVYLHQLFPDTDVVQFHYRGYRPSTGEPSAEALLGDASLIHDYAVERINPRTRIAVGFSIGSGIAAHMASQRKLDGVVLVTPFDSLKAVAADQYPWLPVAALFAHEIDAASALEAADVPVAIIAAGDDMLIGKARTDALRAAAKRLAFDHIVAHAGHNDIYHLSEFHHAMREALDSLSR
jgi:pimeloyl-ACP methyl ester carboxylesterase